MSQKVKSHVVSNIVYLLKTIWQWDKAYAFLLAAQIPIFVSLPLTGLYLSKFAAESVQGGFSIISTVTILCSFSAVILLLSLLKLRLKASTDYRNYRNELNLRRLYLSKYMNTDYCNIESVQGANLSQRAVASLGGAARMMEQLIVLFVSAAGIFAYGSILTTLNGWILLIIIVCAWAHYYLTKWINTYAYRDREIYIPVERKLNYLHTQSKNFFAYKDIMMYNMKGWFSNLNQQLLSERIAINNQKEKRNFGVYLVSFLLSLLRDGVIYGFLIFSVFTANLSVSDFVLFLGATFGFSGCINEIVGHVNELVSASLNVNDLRAFFDMKDHSAAKTDVPTKPPEIQFSGVDFSIGEKQILKDIHFTIHKGEKIAIVGLNGAGKTTLVKLMCGLYHATGGTVLLDGVDINMFGGEALFALYSVVFQDIYLLPVTIAENISMQRAEDIDWPKLERVAAHAGLDALVQTLTQGFATKLVKSVSPDAVDLSGGQKQRLAIARALYKNGQVVILDEPTSALDPIAESEIYEKYNELIQGKTAIFISHRLASTRFCDKIYLLEHGQIVESGTHDQLMAQGGRYAELYEVQSQYYQEEFVKREGGDSGYEAV